MADIQEYKCPNCGGILTFEPGTQKMKCPYCDSEIDVQALADYDNGLNNFSEKEEMRWETPGNVWHEGETEGMRIYVCKSCGGQIVGDENMGSTACPFCGNPVVMMGQFSGDLKPDLVIPFKLDKEAAKKAYLNHIGNRKLLPSLFRNKNHIDEIKGMYVPCWLFDTGADGRMQFMGTRMRVWADGRNQYTETQYFDVYREGHMEFKGLPVDGSSKMPNNLMESLEPYDLSEAVDFQTAYLSGYLTDRYDVTAEECIPRVNERVKQTTFDTIASTVQGYQTVSYQGGDVRTEQGQIKYAMYPVWILNTTFGKEHYLFAMNGQTGKMVGDLPIDNGKVWKYRLLWTGILGVIFSIAAVIFRFFA